MSTKQVNDTLFGYNPPIFPPGLKMLRLTERASGITNGTGFKLAGPKIKGFVQLERPKTIDTTKQENNEYDWFWAMQIKRNNATFMVCFPWAQDWDAEDGDTSDRSIAIYIQGQASEDEISALILDIQTAMEAAGNELKMQAV